MLDRREPEACGDSLCRHKHCHVLTCGPTQELRAQRPPWVADLMCDRTDVIAEGGGERCGQVTARPTPPTGCQARVKDAVLNNDRPLLSARPVADCDSNRDQARLPPSPPRPPSRHTLPGIELRSRRTAATNPGSLCPAARPAPSRRLRPHSSRPPRHRSGPDPSDAQRLHRRPAAAVGRTRSLAPLIGPS